MMENRAKAAAVLLVALWILRKWWRRRELTRPTSSKGLQDGLSKSSKVATLLAHAGCQVDQSTGALTPPIHLASTFERDEDLQYRRGFVYSRIQNPTRDLLEKTLARAEGGSEACAFASGSAAAAAVFQSLPRGFVLIPDDMYHGNRAMILNIFAEWGLRFAIVDMSNQEAVREAMQQAKADTEEGSVLLWTETPSNPLLKVTDLAALSTLAQEFDITHIVDSTWLTPALCQPLHLGCDLVLHSTTKYLGGHSDHLGGAVIVGDSARGKELFARIRKVQTGCGAVLPPFDCWLLLRGLRSLAPRMLVHSHNALLVAQFLETHPAVEAVFYPGLESHPAHQLAVSQVNNIGQFGGMLSFLVKGGEDAAVKVAASVKSIKRGTSLGGTETLIEHRASIEDKSSTTPRNLLRMSIGLEDANDLIDDLEKALDAL